PQETPDREPGAVPGTVHPDRLDRVAAAAGLEATARGGERGDALLIEIQHPQKDPGDRARTLLRHGRPFLARAEATSSAVRKSRTRSSCEAVAEAGLARITTIRSGSMAPTTSAAIWRSRRLTR